MLFKKLINIIYDSEINCRLEWFWDNGFTWYLLDSSKFPRILLDGDLEELNKDTIRSRKYSNTMKNPIYEKDWICMGCCEDIEDALCELMDAVIKYLPKSTAAIKLQDFNDNRDHFIVCGVCGDLMDCRDLGDVFSHEHGKDIPVVYKDEKYIAKREGDNTAWINGKPIDLN